MRRLIPLCLVLSGCVPPPPAATPPPATLAQTWLFGIERMRGDPLLLAPFTNRLIADLAAQPMVRVVSLDNDTNAFLFNTVSAPKLRVMSWLRGEQSCMQFTTSIVMNGQQMTSFGLIVAPLPAGPEPDSACVDRAATELYHALAVQGL